MNEMPMMSFAELRAWHARIVAANPGEVYTHINVWSGGEVTGKFPAYLPAWMRCDEREQFLAEVERLQREFADDEAALDALHEVPGVPMRRDA